MTLMWIAIGAGVVVTAAAAFAIKRFLASAGDGPASADLGTVSDSWLSDNRARKDL